MKRLSHVAAAALPIFLLYGWALLPLAAAQQPGKTHHQKGQTGLGSLVGVVTDTAGAPLKETLVSASGPAGVSVAVCDSDGRFEFRGLSPGTYLLRAHLSGFAAGRRHVVEIRSGLSSVHAVALQPAPSEVPAYLAAGFGLIGGPSLFAQPDDAPSLDAVETGDAGVGRATGGFDGGEVAPHDDSEKAWRMRRARRSVLKESMIAGDAGDSGGRGASAIPVIAADRTTFLHDTPGLLPVTGQLQLLMRARIQSTSDLVSTDVLPGQIAYASLGGVEQQDRWGLRGAVRTGDAGSWVLAGSYVADVSDVHRVSLGLSYSRQNLEAATTPLALTPSLVGVVDGELPSTTRDALSLDVQGQWDALPLVNVDYGANIARYSYLSEAALVSPNAALTVAPMRRTRVRVAVAQHMLAPGAEEFLPPAEGVWLPPERTFAVLGPADLRAERSRHIEISAEHDIGRGTTIGVRRFHQEIDGQMVTMFGARPHLPVSSSDHYYVASADAVSTDGWGVMLGLALGERLRGAVDYSLASAEWAPWSTSGLSPRTVRVLRVGTERIHDVTTSVEAEIPETATEVFVLYRLSNAFAVKDGETQSLASGLDGRFALRVKQALPFSPIDGSDWQVLVDVRSLFREQAPGASIYDELLVASPPKQVVGGLVVSF